VDEWIFDYERFMDPREVAKQRLLTADQPIAHDGKGGWAVDRSTGTAEWMGGEMQWDVMMREPYSKRDEPGLVDVPEHGGLPSPAPPDGEIARMSDNEARRRVQIGLKLSLDQADELGRAAELFGVTRTTLARLLVVRGAREIVGRAPDSSE